MSTREEKKMVLRKSLEVVIGALSREDKMDYLRVMRVLSSPIGQEVIDEFVAELRAQ